MVSDVFIRKISEKKENTGPDFFFLRMMCRFFKREDLMPIFLPAQFLHIIYIAVIGVLGNVVKRYEWKGRKVK